MKSVEDGFITISLFPISRDPPEGGTALATFVLGAAMFPISRDPPEGGTLISFTSLPCLLKQVSNF